MTSATDFSGASLRLALAALVVSACLLASPISADFVLSNVAGTPGQTAFASGGIGSAQDVARDSSGNIFIAGGAGARHVFKVDTGGNVSIFAGSGTQTPYVNSSVAGNLNMTPSGVDVDENGYVYVTDSTNYVVYRIHPTNGTATTFAGVAGADTGINTVGRASCIAVLESSNIFVGSTNGARGVFRVDGSGNSTRIAGTGSSSGSLVSGPATGIRLEATTVAVESPTTLLVTDTGTQLVWRIDLATGDATRLVTDTQPNLVGVAPWVGNEILLARGASGVLQTFNPTTQAFHTIAGTGTITPYNGGGPDPLATNIGPVRIWTDLDTILFTDVANNLVRQLVPGNDPPVLGSITILTSPVATGATFTISGSFADSDAADVHTVTIDIGDGEPPVVLTLDVGDRTFGPVEFTAPALPVTLNGSIMVSDGTASDSAPLVIEVEDQTPPTVSLGTVPFAVIGTSVTVPFGYADDESGVAAITTHALAPGALDWTSNTQGITPVPGADTSSWTPTLGASGLWTFGITVTDDAGNSSALPGEVGFETVEVAVNITPNGPYTRFFNPATAALYFPMHEDGGEIHGLWIALSGVDADGTVTVSRTPSGPAAPGVLAEASAFALETWSITSGGGLDFESAAVTFEVAESVLDNFVHADLNLAVRLGPLSEITLYPVTPTDPVSRSFGVSGIAGFSDWFLGIAPEPTSVPAWLLLDY